MRSGMLRTLAAAAAAAAGLVLLCSADAFYRSYEEATNYRKGESISFVANKLTSPTALSSIDYSHLSICNTPKTAVVADQQQGSSALSWSQAVAALHGDAFRGEPELHLPVAQDVYCGTICEVGITSDYQDAIQKDFQYNWWLDGLPSGFRFEDDSTLTTRYWGGVPVGRKGGANGDDSRYNETTSADLFVYNHFNIEIFYRKNGDFSYNILRSIIQPFSARLTGSGVTSCTSTSMHTNYDMLLAFGVPLQPATGNVQYTYDVMWIVTDEPSYAKRWDILLTMDESAPNFVEFLGFFLGAFILTALLGALYTWVMRDLSYKPVVDEADVSEEEATEIQMWPLSTRIFFPPENGSITLCVACGTGAHLLVSGFIFVVLFRCGIISQSQGAGLLTPCAIVHSLCSPAGGYVTARLYAIFHGDRVIALAASLITAIAYPLLGMLVLFLVYDVFPNEDAPNYMVMSTSGPLVLMWIFLIWPLTVGGAYVGYRAGVILDFPVSQGSTGYQDLNLQDCATDVEAEEAAKARGKFDAWARKHRIGIMLITGGFLPLISSFISYSYGVAGPLFLGSYSVRPYTIASFLLFVMVSGAVTLLMYYRQIRVHNFQWWWTSFAAGSSAGIYIFILSMSWLLFKSDSNINGGTMALYSLWFAFISLGVGLMTGFAGLASVVWFNTALYSYIMRRQ